MTERTVPYWAGTSVVSGAGVLLMAIYAIPSMFLSNPDLHGHAAVRVGISLAALALLFAMLWLARATYLRNAEHYFQPFRVVLTFVGASALRAIAVAWAFEATGVSDGIDWPQRMLPSVIGFTTALLVVNAVIGSVVEHRRRERLLAREQDAVRQARDVVLTQIDTDLQATAERIRQEMLARVEIVSEDDPGAAAQSLRDAANQVLRPITRELVDARPAPELLMELDVDRRIRIRGLVMTATTGRPLLPVWTAVLVMAFGGPYVISVLPATTALYVLAIGFALVWLAMTIGNAVLVRLTGRLKPIGRVLAVLSVLLVAAVLVALTTPVILEEGPPDVVRRIMLGDLVLIPEMAVALILARVARLQQDSVLQQLEKARDLLRWQLTRARGLQWYDQRALARAMHGTVQSAVALAVVRLEAAEANGTADATLIAAARADIRTALDTLRLGEPKAPGLTSSLTELAGTWVGVCHISWSIHARVAEQLNADPLGSATVSELALEACWNATRHAKAATVEVSLEPSGPSAVGLVVINDGPAPSHANPGIGTLMFDEMALDWDLRRHGARTTLSARIPVA